jgi:hypothetical protein
MSRLSTPSRRVHVLALTFRVPLDGGLLVAYEYITLDIVVSLHWNTVIAVRWNYTSLNNEILH